MAFMHKSAKPYKSCYIIVIPSFHYRAHKRIQNVIGGGVCIETIERIGESSIISTPWLL